MKQNHISTKIALIDNYDSFTYNLVHYLESLNCEVTVFRNDDFEIEMLESFDKIVLSPGPGLPIQAGLTLKTIAFYHKTKPILGVCLGHQAIGEFFGGSLKNLPKVYHGVSSSIKVIDKNELLFNNLNGNIAVGRYHSWVVDAINFPEVLKITSIDANGEIMSFRHEKYNVVGVQFHPESILTPYGKIILSNWLLH